MSDRRLDPSDDAIWIADAIGELAGALDSRLEREVAEARADTLRRVREAVEGLSRETRGDPDYITGHENACAAVLAILDDEAARG